MVVVVSDVASYSSSSAATSPSLPLPLPRTPLAYPDLFGRYRLQAEIQAFNREITFLQEELSTLDGLPPASRCCKEVVEFVVQHPDPVIPIRKKSSRSSRFRRFLRRVFCFSIPCTCCASNCSCHVEKPNCSCNVSSCCRYCCDYCNPCCSLPRFSCTDCCTCSCSCPKCSSKVPCCCFSCKNRCCITCFLC